MTIRKKLIIIQLLTASIVLVLGSAVFVFSEIRQFREDLADNLSSTGLLIGENSASALVFMDNLAAEQVLSSLVVDPRIANACIYDADGQVFAAYARRNEQYVLPAAPAEGHRFEDGHLELFRPVMRNRERIGTVFLRADLNQLTEKINEYIVDAVAVLMIGMALSVLLSVLLQRAISKPIVNLASAARQVSETGDYGLRVAGSPQRVGREDELDALSNSFNEMLELIQNRDASLMEARDTLEQRVEERTLELREAKDEAEQANLAKSVFLANMSHEIRTPMNAILGYAQILRSEELTEQQRRAVQTIDESGRHLMDLINEILDISKIEAGRQDLKMTVFDLQSMVREMETLFADRCRQKGLALEVAEDLRGNPVLGDENKLRQVLINLLGNAVKFTERGEVVLKVQQLSDSRYTFEVQDTGNGIDPERHDEIFEPFGQEAKGGALGGTGLGLSISRRNVELMGGRLEVESAIGQGARFFFHLNLPLGKGLPEPPESERWSNVEYLAPGSEVSALVVDDVETNRDILKQVLERIGVDVETAASGAAALESVRERKPDIVLMDIRMPGIDGSETRRRLIEEHGVDSMRIVAVSASVFEHQRRMFMDEGFDGFVDKPLRTEQVYACLAEQLGIDYERASEEIGGDGTPGDWTGLELPPDLAKGLSVATNRHSVTELTRQLEAVEQLGDAGERLASHLRALVGKYDIAGVRHALEKLQKS